MRSFGTTPEHRVGNPITRRTAAVAVAASLVLAACGGSDSEPPVQVLASPDAFTLTAGQVAQLLANDRVGTAAAVTGTGGNASFTLTSSAPPAGVTVNNGSVSIGASAVPGVVNLSYRLCDAADANNCSSTTAAITIPAPAIVASADSFTLAAGASGDALANDTLGGAAATAATVVATATSTPPAGITLAASGVVSVGTAAVPGAYSIAYRICQTIAPTNCANAAIAVTVPSAGTVAGRVVDSATALGIPGVRVSVGSATATTDATGAFNLAGIGAAERVTVLFSASTHAETARIASVGGTGTTDVQARMVRLGTTAQVDVAAGGTVTVAGSSASVVLPAAAVQRADGSLPSGSMTVRVTPIAPASDTAVMPGDFTTVVAGTAVPIESFGAMNVTLTDSAGRSAEPAQRPDRHAAHPAVQPQQQPACDDPALLLQQQPGPLGRRRHGHAGRQRRQPLLPGHGDPLHHLERRPGLQHRARQRLRCQRRGCPHRRRHVYSDGVDYSGTSSANTDSAGNFSIPIRRGSVATLVGLSGGALTNTLNAGPYTADTTLPACLTLGLAGNGVTMKLTWGQNPSDLDSYLFLPNGARVSYQGRGSLIAAPFANLDVDDTSSFGPEVVTITQLMVGTYKYAVNNFSGQGSGFIGVSGARVELGIPGRSIELYTPPGTGESASTNWWSLFELDVDAQCNITVRRTGSFLTDPPASAASTSPVYCVRPGG